MRVDSVCGGGIACASGAQQRMRAYPHKPTEKKDYENRDGEPRVGRRRKAASTAAAMMMAMVMVTSMPMRAAGRDRGSQVERLW